MGYSGRYHAASLAAVFVALAIGILIGIGLADDVVSGAAEEIESSLRSDLSEASERADGLQVNLDREQVFSEQVFPALVAGMLERRGVAVVELGPGDEEIEADAREAIEAAGGEVASFAVVQTPADVSALLEAAGPRFAPGRNPAGATLLGNAIGSQLAGGGPLIERVMPELFETFSGTLAGADYVVVIRGETEDGEATAEQGVFEGALLEGLAAGAEGSVGIELTTTDPTTLGPITDAGIPTADHLDLPAGKVALVFALLGADGSFGVKDGAAGLIPDLGELTAPPSDAIGGAASAGDSRGRPNP